MPIPKVLREVLVAHRLRSGRATGLVFTSSRGTPVDSWALTGRARKAWKAAGLAAIGLHESRHTYASLMIAAGVNVKALSTYMGHASITITYDRYGHLLPGNEEERPGCSTRTSRARREVGLATGRAKRASARVWRGASQWCRCR